MANNQFSHCFPLVVEWAYLGRECGRDMAVVEEIWAGGVELEG